MKILITIGLIGLLLFIKSLLKLKVIGSRVNRELSQTRIHPMAHVGSITSLTLFPLVEFLTDDTRYMTEAGVSYWIQADNTKLLMDLGLNAKKAHPSPLLHNLKLADKKIKDLDAVFISHAHPDHVGGMKEYKQQQFTVSRGPVDLHDLPVYSPVALNPSEYNPVSNVHVICEPTKLYDGIVSIGAIPRALYLMGYTLENALAFHVNGKGIVLVIGCGHQTIERIIERAKALFDTPIYAIIGGLHLPAGGGRIKLGPLDIQPYVGTERPPWKPINDKDIEAAIKAIKSVNPSIIALSTHDSSDRTLARFGDAFGDKFQVLKVGTPIHIE